MATNYSAEHVCNVCGKSSGVIASPFPNAPQVPLPADWSRVSHDVMNAAGTFTQNATIVLCDDHTPEFTTWRTTPQEPEA